MDMLYLYIDYLIFQNNYATATGLSDLVDGAFAHGKVTRFLRFESFGSKSLWHYVKKPVRSQEAVGGVLILNDSIEEKPTRMRMKLTAGITLMPKGLCSKG